MTKRAQKVAIGPEDAAAAEIRAAIRAAASAAAAELLRLARKADSESVRLATIKELLDRGIGRPAPGESGGGVIAHLVVDDGYPG